MILSLIALSLSAQQAPAAEEATAAKPKLVCRREVDTGTRINRRRTCATKQQWDERRQEQVDAMAQDRASSERSRVCTSLPCR